ncbi:MAG: YdiU family protein [Gammaproteobacteria bacterium]|nr:YdiU family protein [Gammaproteobacteria bacterium]
MPPIFSPSRFHNSYAKLGEDYATLVKPTALQQPPYLIHFNAKAAQLIDLELPDHPQQDLIHLLSGNTIEEGMEPLAMLYAGHQFGHFVPQLGDGRAIMLGEIHNKNDQPWEIQLKGSGLTPYSRQGDGRAVLRSTIREYLCSEAMFGLGIPTTRALCITGSDDEIYRETVETAAVLTRLSPSHVRFGSFEVFYYRQQLDKVKTLADYVIKNFYPTAANSENSYLELLKLVSEKTAQLIAQWQAVGFSHGVLNTDNMSILGLTLDYGPFGFMEAYNPSYVCNHSDHQGRYAYKEQPSIGLWNLSCLAQTLIPLIEVEEAKEVLGNYEQILVTNYQQLMLKKIGLKTNDKKSIRLFIDFLAILQKDQADYSRSFRALSSVTAADSAQNTKFVDTFIDREAMKKWLGEYQAVLTDNNNINDTTRKQAMDAVNPKYILRNYMAQIAIEKAEKDQDYSEIENLLTLMHAPYDEHPEFEHYAQQPPDWANGISVSCSS